MMLGQDSNKILEWDRLQLETKILWRISTTCISSRRGILSVSTLRETFIRGLGKEIPVSTPFHDKSQTHTPESFMLLEILPDWSAKASPEAISTTVTLQGLKITDRHKPTRSPIPFSSATKIHLSRVRTTFLPIRFQSKEISMRLVMCPVLRRVAGRSRIFYLMTSRSRWNKRECVLLRWTVRSTVRKMPGEFSLPRRAAIATKDPSSAPTLQVFTRETKPTLDSSAQKREPLLKISMKASSTT